MSLHKHLTKSLRQSLHQYTIYTTPHILHTTHIQHYTAQAVKPPVKPKDDVDPTKHKSAGGSGTTTTDYTTPTESEPIVITNNKQNITPSKLVELLNQHIVGQVDAKKAVAVAMRNRWRRHRLNTTQRQEITPKNILLIGPTGSGKTEIARRLANITQSPFIKVEATKFTETGFYGKDVDSIIKDLTRIAVNLVKQNKRQSMKSDVADEVEDIIIEAICGKTVSSEIKTNKRAELKSGKIENDLVEIEVPIKSNDNNFSSSSEKSLESIMSSMSKLAAGNMRSTERKYVKISDARNILSDALIDKKLDQQDINREAIKLVENDGIVFLDEIDKIVSGSDHRQYTSAADASAEGVQRDLLPLVEGTTIETKYGNVNTDHILFICSGSFHSVKPADMLPELQGRLPIRVSLNQLTENDLYDILTKPANNLIRQNIELLKTEQVHLEITEEAIREIARVAFEVNRSVENLGARRLYAIVTRVLDDIAYSACDSEPGSKIVIDKQYVTDKVQSMLKKTDLSRYIL